MKSNHEKMPTIITTQESEDSETQTKESEVTEYIATHIEGDEVSIDGE